MSIIRKRSAAHKAYIPTNARDNQYLLAEFEVSDELIALFSQIESSTAQEALAPFHSFYHQLCDTFFTLCKSFEIENCQLIANDKLARVRYSDEMHQWQTNQQILFYYNPQVHKLQKAFCDPNVRSKKITLLFLATGHELRINSAGFHHKVCQMLTALQSKLPATTLVRLRDHQHLTYDLFTKQKQSVESVAHKLRPINVRYAASNTELPAAHSALTYAVVNMPLNLALVEQVNIDQTSVDPFNPLYTYISDRFSESAKKYNLNNAALIANGLVPVVRWSSNEVIANIGELQMLGYNPEKTSGGLISRWNPAELVESIQLVFVATKENKSNYGYGRFLNQIEKAVKALSESLNIAPEYDEVVVRFHQHIGYNLAKQA